MKLLTRICLISFCYGLCVAGVVAIYKAPGEISSIDTITRDDDTEYQRVATHSTFNEFERLIRKDALARSHHGRIEFGSVRMASSSADVQVLFFASDGRMTPVLYKFVTEKNGWRISGVQRMWFVPRSHLLRGLRV